MEDAALDRSHGNAQFVGDLIVMETVQEHGERPAEIVLESGNRGLDVVDVDERGDRVMMVVLTRVQEVLVLRLVDDGILESLPLVVIDEDVPHDGIQPSFDVRPFLEVVLVAECFDEGLLHEIIGILPVTGETHGEAGKEILMADQKVVELNSGHLFNVVFQRLNKNSVRPMVCSTFLKHYEQFCLDT